MSEADSVLKLPIRVASIDVGSNALRFLAVEFKSRTHFDVLARNRYSLRLGHDVFSLGIMKDKTIDSAIHGIKIFKNYLNDFNIENYRAIATSAVRESKNGDELIERVRNEVGVTLEKISGHEELRLIYVSVKNRIHFGNEQWVLADIGGGSVEVSLVDKHGILWSESYKTGAVRLLEELKMAEENPRNLNRFIEESLQKLRIPILIKGKMPAGFIATGGNIETIGRLIDPSDNISRVSLKALRDLIQRLASLSYHDRIRKLSLPEDRADVILPAALIYEKLAILAALEEVIIPHAELCEGIVLDLADCLRHY